MWMNSLRVFIVKEFSSLEEEEDDGDFEQAVSVILNGEICCRRVGSQFSRLYINQDRAEGHTKVMKDYFNPDATYLEKYFCRCFWMHVSPFPSWKPKVIWKK
jgi:hypothetical protein